FDHLGFVRLVGIRIENQFVRSTPQGTRPRHDNIVISTRCDFIAAGLQSKHSVDPAVVGLDGHGWKDLPIWLLLWSRREGILEVDTHLLLNQWASVGVGDSTCDNAATDQGEVDSFDVVVVTNYDLFASRSSPGRHKSRNGWDDFVVSRRDVGYAVRTVRIGGSFLIRLRRELKVSLSQPY